MNPTLVAGLCSANGQAGGTIHQFIKGNWYPMQDAYIKLLKTGMKFTKEHFEQLAARFELKINW